MPGNKRPRADVPSPYEVEAIMDKAERATLPVFGDSPPVLTPSFPTGPAFSFATLPSAPCPKDTFDKIPRKSLLGMAMSFLGVKEAARDVTGENYHVSPVYIPNRPDPYKSGVICHSPLSSSHLTVVVWQEDGLKICTIDWENIFSQKSRTLQTASFSF